MRTLNRCALALGLAVIAPLSAASAQTALTAPKSGSTAPVTFSGLSDGSAVGNQIPGFTANANTCANTNLNAFFPGAGVVASNFAGILGSCNGGPVNNFPSITLLFNQTIFSFGFMGINGNNNFTVTNNNGSVGFSGPGIPQTYYGIDDAAGFNSVTISTTGGVFGDAMAIDDITTTTTPEPASMALLATGLVGVVAVARRRNRKA